MKFDPKACGTNNPITITFDNSVGATEVRVTAEQLAKTWKKPLHTVKIKMEYLEKLQQRGKLTDKAIGNFFWWLVDREWMDGSM